MNCRALWIKVLYKCTALWIKALYKCTALWIKALYKCTALWIKALYKCTALWIKALYKCSPFTMTRRRVPELLLRHANEKPLPVVRACRRTAESVGYGTARTCAGRRGRSWPGSRRPPRTPPRWTARPTSRRCPAPGRRPVRARTASGGKLSPARGGIRFKSSRFTVGMRGVIPSAFPRLTPGVRGVVPARTRASLRHLQYTQTLKPNCHPRSMRAVTQVHVSKDASAFFSFLFFFKASGSHVT